MDNETIQITYEAIENPILRLLIIFLAVAIGGLATTVIYLYRERQTLQREMIDLNKESIRVYDHVKDALDGMQREISAVREALLHRT